MKEKQEPERYIDSQEYFSWERYFTSLLIEKTEGTYLKYQKSRLNPVYLHERNKDMILDSIKGIEIRGKEESISASTLADMDRAVTNLKRDDVSPAVDLSDL